MDALAAMVPTPLLAAWHLHTNAQDPLEAKIPLALNISSVQELLCSHVHKLVWSKLFFDGQPYL